VDVRAGRRQGGQRKERAFLKRGFSYLELESAHEENYKLGV
jgi:hypothetical protein